MLAAQDHGGLRQPAGDACCVLDAAATAWLLGAAGTEVPRRRCVEVRAPAPMERQPNTHCPPRLQWVRASHPPLSALPRAQMNGRAVTLVAIASTASLFAIDSHCYHMGGPLGAIGEIECAPGRLHTRTSTEICIGELMCAHGLAGRAGWERARDSVPHAPLPGTIGQHMDCRCQPYPHNPHHPAPAAQQVRMQSGEGYETDLAGRPLPCTGQFRQSIHQAFCHEVRRNCNSTRTAAHPPPSCSAVSHHTTHANAIAPSHSGGFCCRDGSG